ncbi:MAG: HRDC domain-containing protein [Candidatus Nanopelagicales bacterium]|jgi:ribonuclease D|nr:HRDC domain-containing protein [Candidatus Nanopelagicales bacterium]
MEPTPGMEATPDPEPTPAPLPPLLLRDGLPALVETPQALADAVAALAAGDGPIAIDTERASGYRYGQRAYLVQLRREGSGTVLVDPIAVPGVPGLAEVLDGPEWVLHAASQDLPCLAELGLHPRAVFDTELAGRLLGLPRVGLAPMVEELLGHTLAKGHGAADWSKRPLPGDWLEYAALDVEVLLELRDLLAARLAATGKAEWAAQEFEAVRTAPPAAPRTDPWRRTSGIHRIRSRRGLAVVARLWHARESIAAEVDTAPGRLLPDASIVAAGHALPRDPAALRALKEFTGRGAARYHRTWSRALREAWETPEQQLPEAAQRGDGPPPPRAWAQRDPAAAGRLGRARAALAARAEALEVPVENLVTPELVRRLAWQPPAGVLDPDDAVAHAAVAAFLAQAGARPWQVDQVAALIADALRAPA